MKEVKGLPDPTIIECLIHADDFHHAKMRSLTESIRSQEVGYEDVAYIILGQWLCFNLKMFVMTL